MPTRKVTSGALGALATVLAWAAWSALGPHDPSESALPAEASVAQVAPTVPAPPATAPRAAEQAGTRDAALPQPTPAAPARPAPPLRDGLVMEHGMPTAVHALAADGAQGEPAPVVALPDGARPEDAVVNRAGVVALTRSTEPAAANPTAPLDARRPVTITRAP